MVPPLLKARARLATAAVVLIAAVALLHYDIPPVPTWFYVLAWYPTLVILDQVVVLFGGESLLARPPELAAMLWWSAVIWFLFEALNFRLQNWYYVFLPASRTDRWAGITISLATVVPPSCFPSACSTGWAYGTICARGPSRSAPRSCAPPGGAAGRCSPWSSRSPAISTRSRGAPCGSWPSRPCTSAIPSAPRPATWPGAPGGGSRDS